MFDLKNSYWTSIEPLPFGKALVFATVHNAEIWMGARNPSGD